MDALEHAQYISSIVSRGKLRKYYRFRWAPFYGGIATADCVGCCLRCLFCWSWRVVNDPQKAGKFYGPDYVARQLIRIADKKKCAQLRISGNEATLNREHLIELLNHIPPHYQFILETNGILLGNDKSYCRDLADFPHLHVRVSFKGCCREDFKKLTGMNEEGFDLQIRALTNLLEEGVSCHPAVMSCFSSTHEQKKLIELLGSIDKGFQNVEEEDLILYPEVEKRLMNAHLL